MCTNSEAQRSVFRLFRSHMTESNRSHRAPLPYLAIVKHKTHFKIRLHFHRMIYLIGPYFYRNLLSIRSTSLLSLSINTHSNPALLARAHFSRLTTSLIPLSGRSHPALSYLTRRFYLAPSPLLSSLSLGEIRSPPVDRIDPSGDSLFVFFSLERAWKENNLVWLSLFPMISRSVWSSRAHSQLKDKRLVMSSPYTLDPQSTVPLDTGISSGSLTTVLPIEQKSLLSNKPSIAAQT